MILNIAHIHSSSNNGVCTGHYLPLASLYQKLFADKCHVRIAGGPLYAKRFESDDLLELPYSIDVNSSRYECLKKMLVNAKYLFSHSRGQIVVLQDGLPVANHICILLCYKKCSLYLIKYHTDGVDKKWKRFLFSLIKKRIKGVICPNDSIGRAYGLPYCVVPDYIYSDSTKSIDWISYTDKKYDFSCLGRIEPEKGVLEVAKKFAVTNYKVLIAGNPSSQWLSNELNEICGRSSNITLRLGYLSDEDYNSALRETRYAMLNYQGVYANRSSGVVYDMLFNGVPVLGRRCFALQFVAEENMGAIYDDVASFNPDRYLNETIYNSYLENIRKYFLKHKEYKDKLAIFLGIK